jgi:tRNA (guanine-N7-)-methyltransferase
MKVQILSVLFVLLVQGYRALTFPYVQWKRLSRVFDNIQIQPVDEKMFSRHSDKVARTRSTPLSQRWYKSKQQHISKNQKRALRDLWPKYGIDLKFNDTLHLSCMYPGYEHAILDLGFGTGDSLLFSATRQSNTLCIGCDIHRSGIAQALIQLEENNITNAYIVRADAAIIIKDHLPENSLDEVHVYFPDPWPNSDRDKLRRIIRSDMLLEFHRVLRSQGLLKLSTDAVDYAQYAIDLIKEHSDHWMMDYDFVKSPQQWSPTTYRPLTKYEQKAIDNNRPIRDLIFRALI